MQVTTEISAPWWFQANEGRIVWLSHAPDATLALAPKRNATERTEMPESTPCPSKSSRTIQSSDGRIVLDIENGRLISINRTGSQILNYLDQGWDELRIAAEISQESETPIQIVLSDTLAFVQSLKDLRLIPRAPSPENNHG